MRYRAMGRIPVADERDANYPFRAVLREVSELRRNDWWDDGWWGDQGYDPHCVAFAWAHQLADGPRLVSIFDHRRPGVDTRDLYCAAKIIDPWDGDCTRPLYDGTSVRAGAEVLRRWGLIDEYRWAYNAWEVAQAVLTVGPVVVGTTWYEGMTWPSGQHVMQPTGAVEGGHAYVVNGVDLDKMRFRIKNSWGRDWGTGGRAYISYDNLNMLLKDRGEACVALQPTVRIGGPT